MALRTFVFSTSHFYNKMVKLRKACVFGLNTGKGGPGNTPYLDTFHAVDKILLLKVFSPRVKVLK